MNSGVGGRRGRRGRIRLGRRNGFLFIIEYIDDLDTKLASAGEDGEEEEEEPEDPDEVSLVPNGPTLEMSILNDEEEAASRC
jgi:hypothetical protein